MEHTTVNEIDRWYYAIAPNAWQSHTAARCSDWKSTMKAIINGEEKIFPAPLSVENLLQSLGIDPRKVAVERNLEIVPKSTYGQVMCGDGDRLEIVHFIGGGN